MARPSRFIFAAADRDGVCASQTRGSAGALILNGALLDLATTMQAVRQAVLGNGIQRTVSVYSTADYSLVNFTITGLDVNLKAISETIAGPNNGTVYTAGLFMIVTGVSVSAAVATAVEIGSGTTGNTRWYYADNWKNPNSITVGIAITATVSVTVQNTLDDVNTVAEADLVKYDHTSLAALTASAEGSYAFPPRFIRAVLNSSSGVGAFVATIIQAG